MLRKSLRLEMEGRHAATKQTELKSEQTKEIINKEKHLKYVSSCYFQHPD